MNQQGRPGNTFWEREREEEEKSNIKQWPLYKLIQNLKNHLINKPWVSLGAPFIWPWATFKQKNLVNCKIFSDESNKLETYVCKNE